jgi:hypothetical protein
VILKDITKTQNISFAKVQDHFPTNSVIHKESVPKGQRGNSVFYVAVVGRSLVGISRVRPQFRVERYLVPSKSALVVKIFLDKHGVVEQATPRSPDHALVDFFSL